MLAIGDLVEFGLVDFLTQGLERSPLQKNQRHMADAEILELPSGDHLAVTIDGLFEEYKLGLLRDPEVVGWANVVHSLSDLAAVGARPLGVLLSYALPKEADREWIRALNRGASEALKAHGTFCLGGDTSTADEAIFHCVGVGMVSGKSYLTRQGARPGDRVYATGPFGMGNLLGLTRSMQPDLWAELERSYRPQIPFALVEAVKPFLRACIDSSDGLFSALDLLMRTNQLGFRFRQREEVYHPTMVGLSHQLGTPLWIGGAFGMGEYRQVMVVAQEHQEAFLEAARAAGEEPLELGEFLPELEFRMVEGQEEWIVDTTRLLNLFSQSSGPEEYIRSLFAFDGEMRGSQAARS